MLQSITIYAMLVFLLPKTLSDEMTVMIRKFWWSGNGKERGICWKNGTIYTEVSGTT